MKKLLIVVDYQIDFVNGALGFDGAESLETGISKKIDEFRKQNDSIVFTYDTHDSAYYDTQEGKKLPVAHCIKDSEGWQLYGSVASKLHEGDKIIHKPGFGSAELFDWLRSSDFDEIELCGLVSNICVISNAVLAKTALPETEIIVDARLTAGPDSKLHKAALDVMAGLQITVINR